MSLEEELINDFREGNEVNTVRALLILSGCETEQETLRGNVGIISLQSDFDRYVRG